MAAGQHNTIITTIKVRNFKRIMAQLDKTLAEKKVLKIVEQARVFLKEHDLGWDTISIRVPSDYVVMSQRRKAAKANGHSPIVLGGERRDLLKRAIIKHPDWETVRLTLGLDSSHMRVADLVAVAELLGIDPKFVKLFEGLPEDPPVTPPGNEEKSK
jgi:Holliday junction resolvase-like predicted endonuclease